MSNISSVFYAESYHPIQAGSIDGTDIVPHDNAVYRAHLCSTAGLCNLQVPPSAPVPVLGNYFTSWESDDLSIETLLLLQMTLSVIPRLSETLTAHSSSGASPISRLKTPSFRFLLILIVFQIEKPNSSSGSINQA